MNNSPRDNRRYSSNFECPTGFIPLSPYQSSNYRGGRQDMRFSGRQPHRNSGFGHNHSPYNYNQKHFNKGPRFENSKPKDISAYYHKSMIEDPWARLEKKFQQKIDERSNLTEESDITNQAVTTNSL